MTTRKPADPRCGYAGLQVVEPGEHQHYYQSVTDRYQGDDGEWWYRDWACACGDVKTTTAQAPHETP